jgi:hypothetical protein
LCGGSNIEIDIPAEAFAGISMCQRLFTERGGGSSSVLRETLQPTRSSEQRSLWGQAMRDIRGDLQVRASLLEDQLSADQAQFEKFVEQIKAEHEAKLKDLRAEFNAVTKLLELEQRRLGDAPQAPKSPPTQAAPQAVHQHQSAHQPATHQVPQGDHHPTAPTPQPPQPFADFLVGKLKRGWGNVA